MSIWTARSASVNNNWNSVTYGKDLSSNGIFVAVAYSGTGNRVMTSYDGINWTSRTSAADNSWFGVTYGVDLSGNGIFVAVASSGTNRVMTSYNGINWTARNASVNNNWTSVTYGKDLSGNGLFVAVASSGTGNRVMTSYDGINWTTRTSAANNSWWSVTYSSGLFVAVSTTGTNSVMTSYDGINWTSITAISNSWASVISNNTNLFVSIGDVGTNRVMTANYLNPTISNFTIPNKTYGDNPFTIIAPTSNSSGSFSYTSLNTNIATVSSNTVTIVGTGNVAIRATQYASDNYISGSIDTSFNVAVLYIPICFTAGTPVETDQGKISIEKIDKNINTIRDKKIVVITKTITNEDNIVCIEKDALGNNIPSQKTLISRNHKLLYNKQMIKAKHLVEQVEGVYNKKYNGEVLYNVLLETHSTMMVNNLIVETLDPTNIVAQLYNGNYTDEERNNIIVNINQCVNNYKNIYGKLR